MAPKEKVITSYPLAFAALPMATLRSSRSAISFCFWSSGCFFMA